MPPYGMTGSSKAAPASSRGPSSIRALAQTLGRDYRGVHSDVGVLVDAGLIERDDSGAISVPWSRVTAEMALDVAASA